MVVTFYYILFVMFAGERIFTELYRQLLDSHALEGEIDDYTKMGSESETKQKLSKQIINWYIDKIMQHQLSSVIV